MKPVKGKDKFQGVFDFFEWSAPYYMNPKDVIRALDAIDYKGKRLKSINLIGIADNIGNTNNGLLYRKITEAGIELEDNWWETYPNIDKVMVPWEIEACEPVQLVFDDGTTLEFLPIGHGGARIGVNTIPAGMTEGLNHSNFDANCFFAEAIGKELRSIEMRVEKKTKQYISSYSLEREKPYEELRSEYRFCLDFEYPIKMELVQTWESWYKIKMFGSGWDYQIAYSRVRESTKQTDQICIVNGRDGGGTFWIVPICSKDSKDAQQFFVDNYGMSIDDYYVSDYLGTFLYKYFDPSIQKDSGDYSEDGKRAFDWYGGNLYSFDSMRSMLKDVEVVISLLENDYDNPLIADVKSRLPWYPYTNKTKDELSEAEINELRKKSVPNAIDFYKRFIKRMEAMMLIPGRDIMSFAGP